VKKNSYIVFFSVLGFFSFSQTQKVGDLYVEENYVNTTIQDPLKPSKAAFYSAVLPGLGQFYNKDYWKIPIVFAAIGTPTAIYIHNNKQYNRYRDAYKRRLAGFKDDEFQGDRFLSDDILIEAQKQFRRNRDLSLMITLGFYILNIVEANIAAHLKQFNVTENLSINTDWYRDELNYGNHLGVSLKFRF